MVSGEIVAGPHVRNACKRHIADLKRKDGIWFDQTAANHAFAFFEEVLKLSEGQFEGQPFQLEPSQAFIIGSLFGWKRKDGRRRFRRAYIEQGKGNGKSPIAGGIGVYGMTACKEAGAQIYAAAAKKEQATQLHAAQEALRKPQVFAFGQRQLKTGKEADWVAGVGVRWTLLDSIDRNTLAESSQRQIAQADRTGAQAQNDIALLVEKRWLALEQARRAYLALQPGLELADEVLRLRTAGLKAGTSTTLDLIDAQVNQAKAQTERAQAAHDYVKALAELLESCGLSEDFGKYMARADALKVE